MICCMADLQFMAFELDTQTDVPEGWAAFDARAEIGRDEYGRKKLKLKASGLRSVPPPGSLILDVNRPGSETPAEPEA